MPISLTNAQATILLQFLEGLPGLLQNVAAVISSFHPLFYSKAHNNGSFKLTPLINSNICSPTPSSESQQPIAIPPLKHSLLPACFIESEWDLLVTGIKAINTIKQLLLVNWQGTEDPTESIISETTVPCSKSYEAGDNENKEDNKAVSILKSL